MNDPEYEAKQQQVREKAKEAERRGEKPPSEKKQTTIDTTLTDVSRSASEMLDSCIDLILLADQRREVKRCWIVRTVEEGLERYTHFVPDENTNLHADDFTDMYTNLAHEELIAGVHSALDDAVEERAKRHATTTQDAAENLRYIGGGVWVRSTEPSDWNVNQLKNVVEFIVKETFLLNGGDIFQQKIGVAMGDNASPQTSTLFLFTRRSATT